MKNMKIYISLLRAINMGNKNRIKMDILKKMYEDMDFQNVRTHLQSGNIIFETKNTAENILENLISAKIRETFGFNIIVIVFEIRKLQEIIANNPFADKESKYLYVTILAEKPQNEDIDNINQKCAENEKFSVAERIIYLYLPNGYIKSKLSNTLIEKMLKVNATTRIFSTINALINNKI
jgi:uncharacterized protein (DUF1697 family)